MNDDDFDQRLGVYGARWREAHPFTSEIDTSRLHRRSGGKTLAAVVAAAAVVSASVGFAAALRSGGSSNTRPVSPSVTLTTPTSATTTTGPSPVFVIPSPQPAVQVEVLADQPPEPLAVGNQVWIGTPTGVDTYDPVTLRRVGYVPVALPVLELASSSDGAWVLSGRDKTFERPPHALEPYRLERINPATLRVEFSKNLPYDDGYQSDELIRLVAAPGTAWIAFGSTVVRVSARTGDMTSISLSGRYAANIAADNTGLWVETGGTDGRNVTDAPLVHIDATTNTVTTVPGLPAGFYWSIATTPNAVWVLASTSDNRGGLTLMRVDPATHAIRTSHVPGITLVAGDNQLWAQIFKPGTNSFNFDDLVGQIDTTTGRITRTIKIAIGEVNGSSGNGYAGPPFAVAAGHIWSGFNGLQRTSLRN